MNIEVGICVGCHKPLFEGDDVIIAPKDRPVGRDLWHLGCAAPALQAEASKQIVDLRTYRSNPQYEKLNGDQMKTMESLRDTKPSCP